MRFFYLNYFLAMKDTFLEGYSNANSYWEMEIPRAGI